MLSFNSLLRVWPIGALMALGLSGVLMAGCAGSTSDAAIVEMQGSSSKDISVLDTFTTIGKPTKMIKTLGGTREVYDPLQDSEVVQAFTKIKQQNYKSINELYADGSAYDYANQDIELLFLAREIHHLDVMRSGCKRLISFECGASRNGDVRLLENSCDLSSLLGHSRKACEGDFYTLKVQSRANGCTLKLTEKVLRPNIYYQLLSSDAVGRPNISPAESLREGLTYFFDYQCQKW